jgi:hypothetical protein
LAKFPCGCDLFAEASLVLNYAGADFTVQLEQFVNLWRHYARVSARQRRIALNEATEDRVALGTPGFQPVNIEFVGIQKITACG